ncbi:MAG: DUF86 domain-containing protein [Candidatus Micrarchaeia archaeon]|jgi:uncharacterized protein with HEPN domain
MKRDYLDYFADILDSIEDIENFVSDMKLEEFEKDKKTVNAVVRSLEVIGEATKNIPDELRGKHPEIPWKRMAMMRDKLIHWYFGVETQIVWEVATNELPKMKIALRKIYEGLQK